MLLTRTVRPGGTEYRSRTTTDPPTNNNGEFKPPRCGVYRSPLAQLFPSRRAAAAVDPAAVVADPVRIVDVDEQRADEQRADEQRAGDKNTTNAKLHSLIDQMIEQTTMDFFNDDNDDGLKELVEHLQQENTTKVELFDELFDDPLFDDLFQDALAHDMTHT